jgi:hypothetical protein
MDVRLDTLRDCWRAALDTAEAALEAAKVIFPADGLNGRGARLRDERTAASRALESLARDSHITGWAAGLRAGPARAR